MSLLTKQRLLTIEIIVFAPEGHHTTVSLRVFVTRMTIKYLQRNEIQYRGHSSVGFVHILIEEGQRNVKSSESSSEDVGQLMSSSGR